MTINSVTIKKIETKLIPIPILLYLFLALIKPKTKDIIASTICIKLYPIAKKTLSYT